MNNTTVCEPTTKEAVNLLLTKEQEISNKFHSTITEILRLGADTDRGKNEISSLINHVTYLLDDLNKIY